MTPQFLRFLIGIRVDKHQPPRRARRKSSPGRARVASHDAAIRPNHRYLLGMRVDETDYGKATTQIIAWARGPSETAGRSVCCANTHMAMECNDRTEFREAVNSADLVTAMDALVWALRVCGVREATRVYGPDLTSAVLTQAAEAGIPVGFYGASPSTLTRLCDEVRQNWPSLQIVYAFSPPFRTLTLEEDARITAEIRASQAKIVFVGIGCPKQERWMAEHKSQLSAVLLGVGAAFDLLAGVKPRAPRWMQRVGCEWLFRLATEPSRLWRRYLTANPRFAWRFLQELVRPGVHFRRGQEATRT